MDEWILTYYTTYHIEILTIQLTIVSVKLRDLV